jgi:hypothetical protein
MERKEGEKKKTVKRRKRGTYNGLRRGKKIREGYELWKGWEKRKKEGKRKGKNNVEMMARRKRQRTEVKMMEKRMEIEKEKEGRRDWERLKQR